jgi:hypothetical protein
MSWGRKGVGRAALGGLQQAGATDRPRPAAPTRPPHHAAERRQVHALHHAATEHHAGHHEARREHLGRPAPLARPHQAAGHAPGAGREHGCARRPLGAARCGLARGGRARRTRPAAAVGGALVWWARLAWVTKLVARRTGPGSLWGRAAARRGKAGGAARARSVGGAAVWAWWRAAPRRPGPPPPRHPAGRAGCCCCCCCCCRCCGLLLLSPLPPPPSAAGAGSCRPACSFHVACRGRGGAKAGTQLHGRAAPRHHRKGARRPPPTGRLSPPACSPPPRPPRAPTTPPGPPNRPRHCIEYLPTTLITPAHLQVLVVARELLLLLVAADRAWGPGGQGAARVGGLRAAAEAAVDPRAGLPASLPAGRPCQRARAPRARVPHPTPHSPHLPPPNPRAPPQPHRTSCRARGRRWRRQTAGAPSAGAP